jgi:tetratricopeptide (TPR) repeat protein
MVKEIMDIFLSSRSNKKGIGLLENGKYKEAIKYFDKSLKQDPSNLHSLNNKGSALRLLKKYNEALKCFDTVLVLEGGTRDDWEDSDASISALVNKGSTMANLGEYEKALKLHELAYTLDPDRDTALFNMAIDFAKLKKGNLAIEIFSKFIKKRFKKEIFKGQVHISIWYTNDFERLCFAFEIDLRSPFATLLKCFILNKFGEKELGTEELEHFDDLIREEGLEPLDIMDEFCAEFNFYEEN